MSAKGKQIRSELSSSGKVAQEVLSGKQVGGKKKGLGLMANLLELLVQNQLKMPKQVCMKSMANIMLSIRTTNKGWQC